MFQRILQRGIWLICLALSITVSILFFSALSDNHHYKMVVPVMVVTVESLAQLIFSRGRMEWKEKQYARAIVKIGLYAIYIVFFGVLSSLSYFVSQVAVKEKTAEIVNRQSLVIQERWEQNNGLLMALSKQLDTEAGTGYGSRSAEIMRQVERLKLEQDKLVGEMAESTKIKDVAPDIFNDMADVISINPNVLKLLSFFVLTMFIFAGLIVLNPNITVATVTPSPVTKDKPVTVTRNVVARNDTEETVATGEMTTCECGCGKQFPAQPGKHYYSDACRMAAYRQRKREGNYIVHNESIK